MLGVALPVVNDDRLDDIHFWLLAGLEGKSLNGIGFKNSTGPCDPESVIAKAVHEQDIDMLIMGAYSHSPPGIRQQNIRLVAFR
jgi:hypothetical protein